MTRTRKQRQSIPGNQKYTFKDFNSEFPTIGIYPEGVNRAKWLKVTREIALLPLL
jgi:hypothetical protein